MVNQVRNTEGSVLPFRRKSLSVIEKGIDGRVSIVEVQPEVGEDSATPARKCVSTRPWDLTKPQYEDENYYRYRAISILKGMEFQDGSKHPPCLPVAQALDVVNWNWDTGSSL